MKNWHPQRYKQDASRLKRNEDVVASAISIGNTVNRNDALPIFTLAHLAKQSKVNTNILDKLVRRKNLEPNTPNYRTFEIHKKSTNKRLKSEKRNICVPCSELRTVQRFIHDNILSHLKSHDAVVSYKKTGKISEAAEYHCGSKWLIKVDLKDFFDSISEVNVYRVFRDTGYSALLSFQLARLCTRITPHNHVDVSKLVNTDKTYNLKKYKNYVKGSLPQGAPTSPLLSNLAVHKLDRDIELLSLEYHLIYTRYADDIFLSTSDPSTTRALCEKVICKLYNIIKFHGFEPNLAKTKIIPPGARKIVLGLVVNGNEPRLSKRFKSDLMQHLYFCNKQGVGAVKHAKHKNFDSVVGFKNHLKGLVSYALQIESRFGQKAQSLFNQVQWPL